MQEVMQARHYTSADRKQEGAEQTEDNAHGKLGVQTGAHE